MVAEILKAKKYIPRFYYDERNNTMTSSLSLAIEYNETNLIQLLIEYYINNATEEPGWMQTVIPTLPTLCVEYPEFVQIIVNKLMYIPLDSKNSVIYRLDSITRSSNEYLYAFTLNENLKKETYGIPNLLSIITTFLGFPFVLMDNFWRKLAQRNQHPVQHCFIPLPGMKRRECVYLL